MIDGAARSEGVWRMIQRHSASVSFDRAGVALAAQTVRLAYDNTQLTSRGEVGQATERKLVILGVRDHPTIADTDIRAGDRFAIGKALYEVFDVIVLPGSVQAFASRLAK
mgnify:CR=1 FL=1